MKPMTAKLYFGPDPGVHKREYRNPAFSVFEIQGDTLNIDLRLNNDGGDADRVTINLYALHFSHRSRHVDWSKMMPKEIDEQAILAMAGYPLRAWCDHFVPECSKPAWQSDTVLHRLPEDTVGFLLVATVATPDTSRHLDKVLPSENPQIALWRSEMLGRRC